MNEYDGTTIKITHRQPIGRIVFEVCITHDMDCVDCGGYAETIGVFTTEKKAHAFAQKVADTRTYRDVIVVEAELDYECDPKFWN